MSVARYVEILKSRTLYFCRADHFEDSFEGSLPRRNVALRHDELEPLRSGTKVFQEAAKKLSGIDVSDEEAQRQQALSAAIVEHHLGKESFLFRRFTFVNCWHMNDSESTGMWRLYAPSPNSVAIASTYERFSESLSGAADEVYIGTVRYLDYESEAFPQGNDFERFLTKRKYFEHERELRAVVMRHPPQYAVRIGRRILTSRRTSGRASGSL